MINHQKIRFLLQHLNSPVNAVVGGYHGGNLGDMALGHAVKECLNHLGIESVGLQTCYNLRLWPTAFKYMIGGGAVVNEQLLDQLRVKTNDDPNKVSLCGVDFVNIQRQSKHFDFLKEIPFVSCRSLTQKSAIENLLEKKLDSCVSDLTFAHFDLNDYETEKQSDVVGFNMAPIQVDFRNNKFEMIPDYLEGNDDNQKKGDIIGCKYAEYMRSLIQSLVDKDKTVIHVPFTKRDDLYARHVLQDLPVQYLRYSSNYKYVLKQMKRFESFYSTRFHSLVFSILMGVPVLPYLYAGKCKNLVSDLGYPTDQYYSPDSIIHSIADSQDIIAADPKIIISKAKLELRSEEVMKSIARAWRI